MPDLRIPAVHIILCLVSVQDLSIAPAVLMLLWVPLQVVIILLVPLIHFLDTRPGRRIQPQVPTRSLERTQVLQTRQGCQILVSGPMRFIRILSATTTPLLVSPPDIQQPGTIMSCLETTPEKIILATTIHLLALMQEIVIQVGGARSLVYRQE